MMEALDVKIQVFLLALTRVTAALASVPPLNDRGLPARARIAIAGILAFLVLPAACAGQPALHWDGLIVCGVSEALIGLFVGLVVTTMFEAVSIACRVMETQAGFSLGSSIFAHGGGVHSALGAYYHAVALVLFFTTGAYHHLIRGLASTFRSVPVGGLANPPSLDFLVAAGSAMFLSALHFGAPVVCGILLADVALGLLSRAAPQMNVFAVGFTIKIVVAISLAAAAMAAFASAFSHEQHTILDRLFGAS